MLKLSLEKCQFYQPSVIYLGHVISTEGLLTNPEKLDAITSWPRLQSVGELQSFLGFCSYYQQFIEGFVKIVYPHNDIFRNEEAKDV